MPVSQVYLCDCLDLLRDTPDKRYDLAICDPPYGIGRDGMRKGSHRKGFEFRNWDRETPSREYFNELFRVSKNQIIWGGNYFAPHLPPSMGWVVWDKGQRIAQSDGELAYTSFQKALRVVVMNRAALINEKVLRNESTIHPTQKPVSLYKWLLKNYAQAGDKILDTHLGSGSSRIAAHDMGFDFWACEMDEAYYAAQEARFAAYLSQQNLFIQKG